MPIPALDDRDPMICELSSWFCGVCPAMREEQGKANKYQVVIVPRGKVKGTGSAGGIDRRRGMTGRHFSTEGKG